MSRPRSDDLPPVRIEVENEWAWCGARRLTLPPRAFAVLRHLVEHPGRLVTKDELLAAVWRDAVVSDAALASCIRDVRRALGDPSTARRYVQTVHRRGFRFIGPVAAPAAARPRAPGGSTLVGREAELARLHAALAKALGGQRQLVFVTGEPGIGKTALVERFLAEIGDASALRIGRGQCVEQYGAGEAYLPVLEALGRLGRAGGGDQLIRILKQHAPTWLEQLPGLLRDRDVEAVRRRAQGATRARMLRELVEALDALTGDAPLVLLLEDLHWSDSATIDLLSMLARRRDASRLLVLGTYRPADVAAAAHPLRWAQHELQAHGDCDEIPLGLFSAEAVSEYLARRFPGHGLPEGLALVLHRNTEGNPLFLVNTIDDLIAQEQVREVGGRWLLSGPPEDIGSPAPATLRQLVEKQLDRLTPDEQAALMAASVAGAEFSAAIVAAAGTGPSRGDVQCEALARRGQFLRAVGTDEWADGTVAARYAFIHNLYQQVLYDRVSLGERARLHLLAAELLERGHGKRAHEIAAELAVHFEQGRDFERAVRYRRQAGEHALRRHAYRETEDHARRALGALKAVPDTRERIQQELSVQIMLGAALTATQGYAAPEVAATYARARELCARLGETPELVPVLLGVGRFYVVFGALQTARDVASHVLTLAETTGDVASLVAAHSALGVASIYAGELEVALDHCERAIDLYGRHESEATPSYTSRLSDPRVTSTVYAAWALWMLGYPDRAAARAREALLLVRSLDHPFGRSYVCHLTAGVHQWRGEQQAVQELEDEALAFDTEHGFALLRAVGVIQRGWLLARRGEVEDGLAQMQEGLAKQREIGASVLLPFYLALLANVCHDAGRPAEALSAVTEALAVAQRSGQHYWAAELHRLAGVLALGARGSREAPATSDAERHFLHALEVARGQRARSLELRAATSLGRLWADTGKAEEARALLSAVYVSFTEGFDTADLREAKSLLDELSPGSGESRVGRA
jgi:predicted ATPase/DNA-binding winged helix-turn-helix (wHTH) protein